MRRWALRQVRPGEDGLAGGPGSWRAGRPAPARPLPRAGGCRLQEWALPEAQDPEPTCPPRRPPAPTRGSAAQSSQEAHLLEVAPLHGAVLHLPEVHVAQVVRRFPLEGAVSQATPPLDQATPPLAQTTPLPARPRPRSTRPRPCPAQAAPAPQAAHPQRLLPALPSLAVRARGRAVGGGPHLQGAHRDPEASAQGVGAPEGSPGPHTPAVPTASTVPGRAQGPPRGDPGGARRLLPPGPAQHWPAAGGGPHSPAETRGPRCHTACRRQARGSSVRHTDECGS